MAEKRYFGKRIKRNEDPRLLTGQALFTDDVNLPNMAHVAFVRSPHAHARILSIDLSAVAEKEGIVAIYTADTLGDYWQHGPLLVSPPPIDGRRYGRLHEARFWGRCGYDRQAGRSRILSRTVLTRAV